MPKTKKQIIFFTVILAVLCLLLFLAASQMGLLQEKEIKYTLYIGLNDKDTYTQRITDQEAQEKISQITQIGRASCRERV